MTLEKKVTRRKPASRPAGRRALEPLESLYARLTPVPVVVRRRGTLTRLLLRLQLYSDDDNYIVVVVSLIECRAAERRVYDAYCPVYACAVGKRPVPARIRGPPIAPPPQSLVRFTAEWPTREVTLARGRVRLARGFRDDRRYRSVVAGQCSCEYRSLTICRDKD